MTEKRIIVLFLTLLVLTIVWMKISNTQSRIPTEPKKPQVSATIFPLYDMVKLVAGDSIDVALILPPGASPHTFEPSPQLIAETQKSKIIFAIGYGLDDWTLNLVSDSQRIQTMGDGMTLRKSISSELESETDGPIDPHYWLDGKNAMQMSATIAKTLVEEFPEQKEQIESNLAIYLRKLEKMDSDIRLQLDELKQKSIITFHDAWYYFASAYGLNVVATFEPTVGREPTPKSLSKLNQIIKQTGVKVIYSEPQFSSANLEAFLSDQNVHVASIDPEGSQAHTSYIDLMYANADTIAHNQ